MQDTHTELITQNFDYYLHYSVVHKTTPVSLEMYWVYLKIQIIKCKSLKSLTSNLNKIR
jgi:hypothetical protein